MPLRFSFEELKISANNFVKQLGEGGFGSRSEGRLTNGTMIAVKRLEGLCHIKSLLQPKLKQ